MAHLRPLDLALIVLYLIGITLFGLRFRQKKGTPGQSLQTYFLAGNTIPWWAIALSIVSAETSTLTIISIPGVAFAGDFGFLQVVLGYMIGRIVVAALFLPRYFEGRMLTAYQLIDQRFGSTLHKVTAGLFLLTRAAAEGVRVFAVSIVVGIAIGTGDLLSIALITALTLLYTFEGGLAAVIWTDVVQMVIYVAGTVIALITLGNHVQGGWQTIHTIAAAAGKFHWLNFTFNLTTAYTFWAGLLGGTFLTMASHGTDQLMVQRMLAARNLREARLALLSSGVVIFIQFAFFLLIGAGLYVFYSLRPTPFAGGPAGIMPPDRIFPSFIVHEMPTGIAGLLVAAILAAAMSNLSAALNSLSSTTVIDFYLPWRNRRPGEPMPPDRATEAQSRQRTRIAKLSTIVWAIVLFAVAAYALRAGGHGHVVETGLSIASVAYGALLGVFLLGTLTRYATQTGAILGMILGFSFNLVLWLTPTNGGWTYTTPAATRYLPHVAFTWYVFLGALVTFAFGTLFSLLFRKQSPTRHRPSITTATIVAAVAFLFVIPEGNLRLQAQTLSASPLRAQPKNLVILSEAKNPRIPPEAPKAPGQASTPYDFTPLTALLNQAIEQHKLPGAVVLIGHNGKIVFHQSFGNRKLAGELDPYGQPSPAEPMTEDTIFDMASLTKCLATATAIMQLYEAGKLQLDAPIEQYLPAFNPTVDGKKDPERTKVTIRTLLTHYSGAAPDVDLKDPWGLATPDKAEGIRRALTTPLRSTPGQTFVYSDINFILLGHLVEVLSGEQEDVYAATKIFNPLRMKETRYLAFDKVCGVSKDIPIPLRSRFLDLAAKDDPAVEIDCDRLSWTYKNWVPRVAPTAHDDESKSNPAANPDYDHLLRAVVHDPTTRRMGGVAGHAGVFSTAHDIALYAQALLDKLIKNTGPFPLKQSTLKLMTQPEQPPTAQPGATIFTPDGQPTKGIATRGFGWDINTAFSRPRGSIFPIGSFGHTGFTGTTLWMDSTSNTYVILLANAIHPRGGAPISALRGQVATAAAKALNICPASTICDGVIVTSSDGVIHPTSSPNSQTLDTQPASLPSAPPKNVVIPTEGEAERRDPRISSGAPPPSGPTPKTLTGIDVLEQTHYTALKEAAQRHQNRLNLGILTNAAGLDSQGRRTIDQIAKEAPAPIHLTTLFAAEHGLSANQETTAIAAEFDAATNLPITSLYGPKPTDRRPSHDQLKNLDAVLIDLQDVGNRFWTFDTAMAYFLEASADERHLYHHDLEIIVLDHPNPSSGTAFAVQGPISDLGRQSYIDYTPLPARHGMTIAELALYFNAEATPSFHPAEIFSAGTIPPLGSPLPLPKGIQAHLTVVPLQNWTRTQYLDQTGIPWTPPSPNLRTLTAAILYPGIGLFETTNLSVGRGTPTPFEHFGAPYLVPADMLACLTPRQIPGIQFSPATLTIAETPDHYPYHGQTIPGLHLTLTGRALLNPPELAMEIMTCAHRLYPKEFNLDRAQRILANAETLAALQRGDDPKKIAQSWQPALAAFVKKREPYLLYPDAQ